MPCKSFQSRPYKSPKYFSVKVCRTSSAVGFKRGGVVSRLEDEDLPQCYSGCTMRIIIMIYRALLSNQKFKGPAAHLIFDLWLRAFGVRVVKISSKIGSVMITDNQRDKEEEHERQN